MNAALAKSIYYLTQKNNLADVTVSELSQLVKEFPFFAPAQLVLALKLKEENSYKLDDQLQKTALYFSNPQWLDYQFMNGDLSQIHHLGEDKTISEKDYISEIHTTAVDTPVASNTEQELSTIAPVATRNEIYETNQRGKTFDIPTVESVKDMMYRIDHPVASQPDPQTDHGNFNQHIEHPSEDVAPTLAAYSPMDEDIQLQKLSSVLSSQMADFKKPVAQDTKLDFEKEPFYTIDYFASQGIKFDPAKQPDDKLSQQLMTFTDWLRRMKHVSPNPQDLGTDPELENAIQGIANSSNEAKEIITETMAEIFIKQGKVDKAIQLYIKLSFLYPEKSTYFAAKIQELKGM
jgi:hypothetical protein